MKKAAFLVLIGLANTCCAQPPPALTNAVDYVIENVLGSLHACSEAMSGSAEQNGWTAADCAEILSMSERMLQDSPAPESGYRRQNAISMLWEFGGTNSIPCLISLIQTENGLVKKLAGEGYFRVAASNPFPGWETPLRQEIARSPARSGSFAWSMYDFTEFELRYAAPAPVYHRNLLRFLLNQTSVERGECALLDEILCREVPRWRASPQRAENAARMIREHSADSRLVAFFEAVRTNALESARVARDASPGASTTRAVPADAESDPWAYLLSDLPDKKPWTPPPGEEPPF